MTKKNTDALPPKQITRELPIKVSRETLALRAKEHANVDLEIQAKKDSFRVESKTRAKEIRDLQTESNRLALIGKTEMELGPVACEERYVFADNSIDTVRLDTGEVVERRVMTAEERKNPELPLGGDEHEGKKKRLDH